MVETTVIAGSRKTERTEQCQAKCRHEPNVYIVYPQINRECSGMPLFAWHLMLNEIHCVSMGAAVDTLKTAATRAAIVAAAMPVFVKRGIAQTRVEDLLVAAKLARRTFYKYFASKEAVVGALFDTASEQLVFAMEQARRAAPQAPMAGIRAGIDIYLTFHQVNGKVMREIIELAMRSDSLLHARQRWLRGELVRIFHESVTALDGRRVDPLVYHALLSGLDGMALEMTGEHPAKELARVRQIAHLLVDRVLGLESAVPLPLVP